MTSSMTDARRATLRALCDTFVPSVSRAHDPDGFWARTASHVGADEWVAQTLLTLPEPQQVGMLGLLDALTAHGFDESLPEGREQILSALRETSPEAAAGVDGLAGMTLFFTYGAPDPQTGQNPNWRTFGYPGPVAAARSEPKPLAPVVPQADTSLEADAVVVGSGAGGAVIAAVLADRGLRVVVLEAGGYFNEADFNMLELWAYQNLYWRGGPSPTADNNVTVMAGATLGGGTTVNWTNCLRTRPSVREQWTREHGLAGVDGPDFDEHLDAVLRRISTTGECSDFNGPTQRMLEGAEHLGWSFERVLRNADRTAYDPASAGYMGFGDQSGSKQSAQHTFLLDAARAGAQILCRCQAERVLVSDGRAAGVQAVYTDDAGGARVVTVHAPRVVVAAGSLESPALLLRSKIGGPAVGQHLRLHPCTAVFGVYDEDQQAWWGAPQTGLVDEFRELDDGYGFLIETAQYAPALTGSSVPFLSGVAHKELMEKVRYGVTFIALLRDRGAGRVTVDGQGQALPWYSISDGLDQRHARRGLDALARLHEAAGATEIYALASGLPHWRRGEDLGAFSAAIQEIPLGAGGHRLFSAHQMGSCRMGIDPRDSVAGPYGELHDTPGVWIGDASALPTASGTNPMVSIMALARRTAAAMLAAAPPARASAPVA
jgi:choline dehydrogenase-like flavoprotein